MHILAKCVCSEQFPSFSANGNFWKFNIEWYYGFPCRQYLLDTTMDWTGAVHTRNYGCAMLGTLVMVAMVIGLEELEF